MRHFSSRRFGLIAVDDDIRRVALMYEPPDREGRYFKFPLLALVLGNLPGLGTFLPGSSRLGGARLVGVRFLTIGLGIRIRPGCRGRSGGFLNGSRAGRF
jgi:hypothetical protein